VENKRPTGCNRLVFIAKLIFRSTCFGHHYAHHQELKSYKIVATCGKCRFGLPVVGLVRSCGFMLEQHPATRTHKPTAPPQTNDRQTKAAFTTGSNNFITLELLMMGIMVP
jgi:hypothetical protein